MKDKIDFARRRIDWIHGQLRSANKSWRRLQKRCNPRESFNPQLPGGAVSMEIRSPSGMGNEEANEDDVADLFGNFDEDMEEE